MSMHAIFQVFYIRAFMKYLELAKSFHAQSSSITICQECLGLIGFLASKTQCQLVFLTVYVYMQIHELTCSYISLHAVT